MVYELILTDQCTRHCKFCQIQQTGYVESLQNIQKFIDLVENTTGDFKIQLFGGEPLLNLEGIRAVVDRLARDPRCSAIMLTTNGDLIPEVCGEEWVKQVEWHVSAYDVFNDQAKYQKMREMLGRDIAIQYTFTEDDIYLVSRLQIIARSFAAPMKYKIAFSHSRSSWTRTGAAELRDLIFNAATSELELLLDEFPRPLGVSMAKPLKRVVECCLLEKDHKTKKRFCCLDQDGKDLHSKKVFYRGEFVGPCILARDVPADKRCLHSVDPKCKMCDYDSICTRSCFCELVGEEQIVDDKLCAIEKAQLDAVCQFAIKHQYSRVWREILRKAIDGEM